MGIEFTITHLIGTTVLVACFLGLALVVTGIENRQRSRTFIISSNDGDLELFKSLLVKSCMSMYRSEILSELTIDFRSVDKVFVMLPGKLSDAQMVDFLASLRALKNGFTYLGFKNIRD